MGEAEDEGGLMLPGHETLSLRIVRDVDNNTGGKAMQWVPVATIARRLVPRDAAAVDKATELARANGWLLLEGGHSVALTDVRRSLASLAKG